MRGNKLVKIQHLVFHSSRKCFKKIDFFLPDSNALSFSLKLKIRKSEQHRFNRSIRGGNSCKLEDAVRTKGEFGCARPRSTATRRGHGSNYAIEDDRRGTIDDRG